MTAQRGWIIEDWSGLVLSRLGANDHELPAEITQQFFVLNDDALKPINTLGKFTSESLHALATARPDPPDYLARFLDLRSELTHENPFLPLQKVDRLVDVGGSAIRKR